MSLFPRLPKPVLFYKSDQRLFERLRVKYILCFFVNYHTINSQMVLNPQVIAHSFYTNCTVTRFYKESEGKLPFGPVRHIYMYSVIGRIALV